MSRWKAATLHLSISMMIGLVTAALLLLVWYPPPLFHAAGADTLVLLLVSVDLGLGPLLTLVVFKSGKRGLKFDLSVIALAQAIALVYGLSVVLRARPVFIATAVDRLVVVTADELDPADLAKASKPEFRHLSLTGPILVGTRIPTDWRERNTVLFSSTAGKDIEEYPQYYIDYAQAAPKLLERAKPLDALPARDEAQRRLVAAALAKLGKHETDVVWVPMVARRANLVMLLDRHSGNPLKALLINPWAH